MNEGPTAEEIAKALVAEKKAEDKRDGLKILKGCSVGMLMLVVIFGACVLLINDTEWTGPTGMVGGEFCKDYARSQLKSPSTADFPWAVEARPAIGHQDKPLGEQTWVVRSYVDSQNTFGATVRTEYFCDLKPPTSPDESWSVTSFEFLE